MVSFDFLDSETGRLVLGFALTGVLGAWIDRFFQNAAWKRQTKVDLFRKRYEQGFEFLDELSQLIGRRSYALQRLAWALKDGDQERIRALEVENDRMVVRWNARRYTLRYKIRLLIGEAEADAFLNHLDYRRQESPMSVHYTFVKAHRYVMRARRGEVDLAVAEPELHKLNVLCTKFLERLAGDFAARANALDLLNSPEGSDSTAISHKRSWFDIQRIFGSLTSNRDAKPPTPKEVSLSEPAETGTAR